MRWSALVVAFHSRLVQDSLDGVVLDTEVGGSLARPLYSLRCDDVMA